MTDPRELAKAVVLEGLRNDTAVFTAIQYLGLDFSNPHMLEETFGDALRPEVVTVEVAPESYVTRVGGRPVVEERADRRAFRPIRVMEQPLIRNAFKPAPAMTEDRALFIDWMEKRIPDDDPRIKAMLMKNLRGA